jgi:3-oxoacyl-[acyl-carrier protein] reductase
MSTQTAALVTGAASGIGKCVAERFAADERHDVVACLDLDPAVHDLPDEIGSSVQSYECDVADHDAIGDVIQRVEADADIHAVVNNAGISRYFWIGDLEPDEWDRILDVNLKGQYNVARHATPPMFERETGYVVNVSSGAGQRGSASGGVHYSAAKAGVLGLTKGLAKQLGPHVNVNCVVPGLIDTPLMSESGLWDAEEIAEFEAGLPLERVGDPDEVARVIEFCCGPGAEYMTGSVVNVDGGGSLS